MENLQIRGFEIPVVLQRANRKTMEVTLKEGEIECKSPERYANSGNYRNP